MELKKVSLILKNCYLITMDAERRIYEHGAVAILDDKIVCAGKEADILAAYTADEIYDCEGGVVHPGLIDAHEHLAWHLMRCIVPDNFTVDEVWEKYENPITHHFTGVEEYWSALLAHTEMAMVGTTMFGDTGGSRFHDDMFKGANIVGVKGATSHGISDNYTPELKVMEYPYDKCIELFEDELSRYKRTRKTPVGAHVGLPGMEHTSAKLAVAAKELAQKYNVQLHIHTSVYASEIEWFRKTHNCTPIEFYDSLGILDERTTLIHVIHTSDHDLDILEKRKPYVVHCPGASFRYALGAMTVGRFKEMHERGVKIALGTDSGVWCDGLDMFQQMYLACVGHREATGIYPYFTTADAFEMATVNGAGAMGASDECGSLEVGKAADIVIHTLKRPEMITPADRLQQLIYASQSRSVDSVLIDGKFIVRHGKHTTINLDELAPQFDERQRDIVSRMGFQYRCPWPIIK
jgi:cytosine/adenosine deaminase-related metal-dependent hydrolase